MVRKKLLILLVVAVAIVSLVIAGCAPKVVPPAEEKPAPPAEEKPAPPAAPEAKVFKLGLQEVGAAGTASFIIMQRLVDMVGQHQEVDSTLHYILRVR